MENKKKMLVVDDNVPFVELALALFSGEYEVATASDGPEGLEKAKALIPDIILLDVNMPKMTGVEFAKRLSACRETAGIPVIAITASDYNSLTQSLFHKEHNVKVFMTKLSPSETIKEKVAAVVERRIL
ncbi:MAG: response regulator [Elusimicrobiales bacterium]|nr:response regulator [Elusimicrobiales bacterium]